MPKAKKTESKNTTVWEWNKYGAPDAKGKKTFKEWNITSVYDPCSLYRLPSEWGEEDEW